MELTTNTMTLAQIKAEKTQIGQQISEVCKEINKYREHLKAITPLGQPYRNDPHYIELRAKRDALQDRMRELSEYRRYHQNQMILAEKKAQEQIDEMNARDYYRAEKRNMQAASRRPNGEVLSYLYEFDHFKGTKRRLAIMMIREIGMDRFLELRRIASWDERHGNNDYYKTERD